MRRLLVMGLLGACALSAFAQTEVITPSEAQKLACLVKPAETPRYPERNKLDREYGGMRLLLKFSQPDAPPDVQVLFNSAREDMQDVAHAYVARFRLPCLTPQDGVVSAVQEFSFHNNDRDPTPLPPDTGDGTRTPLCIVMPRKAMDYSIGWSRPQVEHVVAVITFSGDGQQPPAVEVLYSKASEKFEKAVREWVAEYRMPCRAAGDKPRAVEQQFNMYPDNRRRYGFTRERFSLMEFLAMTREPLKIQADFDLNTMGCPFSVRYEVGGGPIPNKARVGARPDPNQVAFLRWLASLPLDFKTDEIANNVFGSQLQIDVPCGHLVLKGDGKREGAATAG